jgi:hypothetical protein
MEHDENVKATRTDSETKAPTVSLSINRAGRQPVTINIPLANVMKGLSPFGLSADFLQKLAELRNGNDAEADSLLEIKVDPEQTVRLALH